MEGDVLSSCMLLVVTVEEEATARKGWGTSVEDERGKLFEYA